GRIVTRPPLAASASRCAWRRYRENTPRVTIEPAAPATISMAPRASATISAANSPFFQRGRSWPPGFKTPRTSKQRVDERRDGARLGEDHQRGHEEQRHDHRREPPPLVLPEEEQ